MKSYHVKENPISFGTNIQTNKQTDILLLYYKYNINLIKMHLGLCWGENTNFHAKQKFPYDEAALR